jgi:hypothetical protein
MYVCMDVWMYGCMDVWMYGCMDVWMYGCMHACMHVHIYICMYIHMYVYIYIYISTVHIPLLFPFTIIYWQRKGSKLSIYYYGLAHRWPSPKPAVAGLLQQVVPECGGSCGGHLTWEAGAAEIIQEGNKFPIFEATNSWGLYGKLIETFSPAKLGCHPNFSVMGRSWLLTMFSRGLWTWPRKNIWIFESPT